MREHPRTQPRSPDREAHLADGIRLFQPLHDHPLSREDMEEIDYNLTGFFRVLLKWRREDQARAASAELPPSQPTAIPTAQALTFAPPAALPSPGRRSRRSV